MRRCIRITGTKTAKLRARVETTTKVHIGLGFWKNRNTHFEVTLGGEQWRKLDSELRADILVMAQRYVNHLRCQIAIL